MKFEQLLDFIQNNMRMSHVYQPLVIQTLVAADGVCTVRQLAQSLLFQDESQLLYYESIVKKMPVPVLQKHGVLERQGELVTLNVKKLTMVQKAAIRKVCEEKLQDFIQKRGLGLWDYRLGETDPVPDSLRYQVLSESGQRCALCGIKASERPLDVDHIIPRSRGGTNKKSNLQSLCTKCNRSKGNKDDKDFRIQPDDTHTDCLFCTGIADRIVATNGTVVAVKDGFPVTKDHLLIIPKRHVADFFEMSEQERNDTNALLRVLKQDLKEEDPSITGFNIGMNCGEDAGQTIFHAHTHLIPRRKGDVEAPRGGVRHVIPNKGFY